MLFYFEYNTQINTDTLKTIPGLLVRQTGYRRTKFYYPELQESRIYNYDVKSVRKEGDVLEFCGLNDSRTGFGQKVGFYFWLRLGFPAQL